MNACTKSFLEYNPIFEKNRGPPFVIFIVPWKPVIPHTCDWNLRMAVHALSSRAPLCFSERRRRGCSWFLIPVTGIWGWLCMRSLHVHLSVFQRGEGEAAVDSSYLWLESEDGCACALFTCTSLFFREKKDRLQLMHFVFPANKKNTLFFRASKALSGDVCFKKSLS